MLSANTAVEPFGTGHGVPVQQVESLFAENLIDEVMLNIHPILLGCGIPLFHETHRQIDLELPDCKTFKNGCLLVSYRVKH
jgi:riboflavin biosynthesis pyrimidine reductase